MAEFSEIIYNSFLLNKMGHAFLIETNNIEKTNKKVLSLVKKINCPLKYMDNCEKDCNICFQIDHFCLPSIRFVAPIGQNIKKEQILEIKKQFNSNSLITKYNIYVIKQAEKLNASSANVLLKFLEDPETETIAFFLVNNKKNIISTVKSRCQVFNDIEDSNSLLEELNLTDDKLTDFSQKLEFVFDNLYEERSASLIKNKNIILKDITEKKDQEIFLIFIARTISEVINKRLNGNVIQEQVFQKYSLNNLVKFVKLTEETIEKLRYNVNMELLLDNYFIKMGELIK